MGCGGSHNAAGQEPSKKTKINKNEQKQKLEELGIDSGKLRGMLMQMAKAFKP